VFTPATLEIAMVSFEGPDQYSQAGGLVVRAKEMCRAFAAGGFQTSEEYVGDPDKPADETAEAHAAEAPAAEAPQAEASAPGDDAAEATAPESGA